MFCVLYLVKNADISSLLRSVTALDQLQIELKNPCLILIQMRFPCRLVLDLFAGSGALGIEALSRGADYAVFVENSRKSAELVNNNLNGSGLQEFSVLYRT